MTSRFLPVVVSNADYMLTRLLPQLLSGSIKPTLALTVCRQYRRRGIANFLQTCDPLRLHSDLQRSAGAYAAYLGVLEDERKVLSHSAPLFDAIACRDLEAARRICERAAVPWRTEEEYEDDFLYFSIVAQRFFLGGTAASLQHLLQRYETVLDGADDPRFVLCQSLVQHDAAAFDAGLRMLVEQREDDYAQGVQADQLLEEDWSTEGNIFVEGMALLRLGRLTGMTVPQEVLFVPDIAVNSESPSFDAERWRDVHSY